ncbi:hypothetical protein EYF80_022411 [Liparis tanakae]|uniref:Secreted protein n=1 Tax=Liparis tanakae TaxID=230148 RepID=A0A4Z2HQP6_9TELE|nr:hypothetical protein EYF80_022411 [Liparis tanakae]
MRRLKRRHSSSRYCLCLLSRLASSSAWESNRVHVRVYSRRELPARPGLYSRFWDSKKLLSSFFCCTWMCWWNFFSSSLSSLSRCSSISPFSLFSRPIKCFWCCRRMRLYPDICSRSSESCSCSCISRVTCKAWTRVIPKDQISTFPSYWPSSMARITSGAILDAVEEKDKRKREIEK